MTASLSAIRAALRARLNTLLVDADPPGPFVQVKNWAGELRRDQSNNPGLEALGDTPAVLLAFGREIPNTTTRMTSGELAQTLLQEWVLFVVVEDAQTPDASVDALDACLDAVTACVIGTQVEDAEMPVELVSTAPWWAAPGSYCYAITVRISRQIARTPGPEDGSVPFDGLEGDVNDTSTDPTLDAAERPAAIVHVDDLQD